MKLNDATRLSTLVKGYQKRLRQVESAQRRTTRLLDAIDDAELTADVMTFLEAAFDDSSDVITAAFATMHTLGAATKSGDRKEAGNDGQGGVERLGE
jgi:hypothetical protein